MSGAPSSFDRELAEALRPTPEERIIARCLTEVFGSPGAQESARRVDARTSREGPFAAAVRCARLESRSDQWRFVQGAPILDALHGVVGITFEVVRHDDVDGLVMACLAGADCTMEEYRQIKERTR